MYVDPATEHAAEEVYDDHDDVPDPGTEFDDEFDDSWGEDECPYDCPDCGEDLDACTCFDD